MTRRLTAIAFTLMTLVYCIPVAEAAPTEYVTVQPTSSGSLFCTLFPALC
ncbi:MAG: hypothetical protein LBI33_05110 [Propionibacteriaceae bacterium]|jgi:hypothetical protein|nr:hypothetical protein [Propionibacteriaceae bacterium]